MELIDGLCSIIVPVYNGQKYLNYFLDSIIAQSYKEYELIVINDGSTDDTQGILLKWKKRFEDEGHSMICVEQENMGQAAAINTGLAFVKGEFMCWPDADDILKPDYLLKHIKMLSGHPDVGFVMQRYCEHVFENDRNRVVSRFERCINSPDNLFDDLITGNNINYSIIKGVARTSSFFQTHPKGRIYESRGGQNWQLVLPLIYEYPYYYIDECLYRTVIRKNSHSKAYTLDDADRLTAGYEDILRKTLSGIIGKEKQSKYETMLNKKYKEDYLMNAYRYGSRLEYLKRLRDYIASESMTVHIRNHTILKIIPFGQMIYNKLHERC